MTVSGNLDRRTVGFVRSEIKTVTAIDFLV